MDYTTYQREWRQKNKDKVRAYQKKWRQANPSYHNSYRRSKAEAEVDRAMNLALPKTTAADILAGIRKVSEGYYDDQCHACGAWITGGELPYIDYNHRERKIQGVICHHCRNIIRHAKRSTERLERIVSYLKAERGDAFLSVDGRLLDD